MRPKYVLTILIPLSALVLLALAMPAPPARAYGNVGVCDEAHLLDALSGGGTVTFSCSGTITLTATITVTASTTIDGKGQNVVISGNNAVRVFTVSSGAALNLNQLTVSDGRDLESGGGIYNYGTLTVSNSSISRNWGGWHGGGICNDGTFTVTNSTISENGARVGAGIDNPGMLTVSNSTIAHNYADHGGGIYSSGTLTMSNSTLANNQGGLSGGGIDGTGPLMIVSSSTFSGNVGEYGSSFCGAASNVRFTNTILAGGWGLGNCCYGSFEDGGGNLSYPDTTCPGIHADPKLGPLQDNGGPTQTMALLPGSPALDAGNDAVCAAPPVNNLDQRGVTRPVGAHCDIGAFEGALKPPPSAYLPILKR